ncbi:hypothetical protein [uncultured Muriicola sp.]|uniref:hypothetical protein n=1 Tax=uncultured Muriicola sp. TaxID=1583102 RepID=UPI0026167213|nr:hypothetical protein [uncultured Muriicola sp.]
MPFRTIWEKEGIKWEFYDFVTSREIWEANEIFFGDPRSKTAKYQLVHTLETTSVEWKPIDIVEVSVNDVAASRVIRRLKMAYIARDVKIRNKIEKYVEISRNLNSDWHFRGFEDEAAARHWISGK